MIALALLYLIIISLLIVVAIILQRYFETYANLYLSNYSSDEAFFKKNETNRFHEEINHVMQNRDIAMEESFKSLVNTQQNSEELLQSLKIYVQSILKLLKTD